MDSIIIKGAKTHNLKNIDLTLPRGKFIVLTGLSGSGKSSLAFDTIYAEGQRLYVESLSTYARQFLELMPRPDVESIQGLSPAIAIGQGSVSSNPRSTVGTVTDISDYLRLLFARVGVPHCPVHHLPLKMESIASIVEQILALPAGTRVMIVAPYKRAKGNFESYFLQALSQGYMRFLIDGEVRTLDVPLTLDDGKEHTVDVVIDRLRVDPENRTRLAESCETASLMGDGRLYAQDMDHEQRYDFNTRYACPQCDYTVPKLEPAMFSANSPQGCCPACQGTGVVMGFDPDKVAELPMLSVREGAIPGWDKRNPTNLARLEPLEGLFTAFIDEPWERVPAQTQQAVMYGTPETRALPIPFEGIITEMQNVWDDPQQPDYRRAGLKKYRSEMQCPTCHGLRLRQEALSTYIGDGEEHYSYGDVEHLAIAELASRLEKLTFNESHAPIANRLNTEILSRLRFLVNVGLGYLSLDRRTDTLSGGESQRIRLAGQIGSGLTGVLYVLDEPSIGLHQSDNDKLLDSLQTLRDLGNTLIVVEHDEDTIRKADYVVDLGPGAGELGGEVIAQGTPEEICQNPASLTGQYLTGAKSIALPARYPKPSKGWLTLKGACGHNLKNVDLAIPVGLLTTVTGLSGSGKSSLVIDTLYNALQNLYMHAKTEYLPFDHLENVEAFDKVVMVDQSSIGRTPRSNPATYTGLFTLIREVFEQTQMSRERGYKPGRFSFNVKGGRCEACKGDGYVKMEMHFLPDVYVPCEVCHGRRYNRETLEVTYKGLNIAEVLNLTVSQAMEIFQVYEPIMRILTALNDVGLGYIRLGQSATTLSGGEAQRMKLATELARPNTGRTLYILDEPTTGLHFEDIQMLLKTLRELIKVGNTVLVIEHNLDVIKSSDWVIDMGPEGGENGGSIVAQGSPKQVAQSRESVTAPYLKRFFPDQN